MNDWLETATGANSTPLTEEMLREAFEKAANESPPAPCGFEENPHIAAGREGLQRCGNCGMPIVVVKTDEGWRCRPARPSDLPAAVHEEAE